MVFVRRSILAAIRAAKLRGAAVLVAGTLAIGAVGEARAVTLEQMLAAAYTNNPLLNAERARNRAVDELVPQALAAYRARIAATADVGVQTQETRVEDITSRRTTFPRGVGLTINQTLFDGYKTPNRVKQADTGVLAAREQLRNLEQNTLLDAVTAYMNVLRDASLLQLQKGNVDLLDEQLKATRNRFNVGEVTRTDVALAESALQGAIAQVAQADATLRFSRATFRRVIGVEAMKLSPGRPIERLIPRKLEEALARGYAEHPAILGSKYGVDSALLQVRVVEGELLPTVTLEGTLSNRWQPQSSIDQALTATIVGRLTVPIFQGGVEYARVREAKETLGQRRLEMDSSRDQVRAAVVQSFGLYEAARARIAAAEAQIKAAEVALNGVREEYRVGQRTTLDVLNAQQTLLNARVTLVTAQADRVIQSYSVLSSTGRLSVARLGLKVGIYEPQVHYDQTRDRWFGLRTPDGR